MGEGHQRPEALNASIKKQPVRHSVGVVVVNLWNTPEHSSPSDETTLAFGGVIRALGFRFEGIGFKFTVFHEVFKAYGSRVRAGHTKICPWGRIEFRHAHANARPDRTHQTNFFNPYLTLKIRTSLFRVPSYDFLI